MHDAIETGDASGGGELAVPPQRFLGDLETADQLESVCHFRVDRAWRLWRTTTQALLRTCHLLCSASLASFAIASIGISWSLPPSSSLIGSLGFHQFYRPATRSGRRLRASTGARIHSGLLMLFDWHKSPVTTPMHRPYHVPKGRPRASGRQSSRRVPRRSLRLLRAESNDSSHLLACDGTALEMSA